MSELSDDARAALTALRESRPTEAQRARLRARVIAATALSGVAASASIAAAAHGGNGSVVAGAAGSLSASSAPGAIGGVAAGAQVSGVAVGQAAGMGAAVASKAAAGVGAKLAGLSLGTKLAGAALAVASATAAVPFVHEAVASRAGRQHVEAPRSHATPAAAEHGRDHVEVRASTNGDGVPHAGGAPAKKADAPPRPDNARSPLPPPSLSSPDLPERAAARDVAVDSAPRTRVERSTVREGERGGHLAVLELAGRGAGGARAAVGGPRVRASEARPFGVPQAPQAHLADAEDSGEPTAPAATSASRASRPAPEASPRLRAESALLLRALSALETGEPCRARALLDEHARRFAQGALLAHERERLNQRLQSQLGADPGRAHCGQKGPLP